MAGQQLAHVRALIKQADPDIVKSGSGAAFRLVSRRNRLHRRGASLEDLSELFNSSLEGNTRRAIDIREVDEVDADAFKELVRAAVALNESSARLKKRKP